MDNYFSDEWLYNALEKYIKYSNSLEWKFNIRAYIHKYKITKENDVNDIIPLAESCYHYYTKNKDVINADKSLFAITQFCNTGNIEIDIDPYYKDELVLLLGKIFNSNVLIDRDIIDCYDCGTVARGVFFSLIHVNRGAIFLKKFELDRLKKMYYVSSKLCPERIMECYNFMANIEKEAVFICNLGLNLSGHVFIIEKRVIDNEWYRYHIYQTCLNAYNLLDYIEQQDLAQGIRKSINIKNFFTTLAELYSCNEWGDKEKYNFMKLFSYTPNHNITSKEVPFTFCWSYIIYDEN